MAWHIRGNKILDDSEVVSHDGGVAFLGFKLAGIAALMFGSLWVCRYFKLGQDVAGLSLFVSLIVGIFCGEIVGLIAIFVGIVVIFSRVVYVLLC